MCGRYSLATSGATLVEEFGVNELVSWSARYNIAPSQEVPALIQRDGQLSTMRLHWGLVPTWAKDRKMSFRLINARAETVAQKASFRSAFRQRRCLILADGYYEWVNRAGTKQPWYICHQSHRPFAFAGLWESWTSIDGPPYYSCSIITCAANTDLEALHHRMPVILPRIEYDTWLDTESTQEQLGRLLKPAANGIFGAVAISTFINSPAHDGPDCVTQLHP